MPQDPIEMTEQMRRDRWDAVWRVGGRGGELDQLVAKELGAFREVICTYVETGDVTERRAMGLNKAPPKNWVRIPKGESTQDDFMDLCAMAAAELNGPNPDDLSQEIDVWEIWVEEMVDYFELGESRREEIELRGAHRASPEYRQRLAMFMATAAPRVKTTALFLACRRITDHRITDHRGHA